jgi:hypothetical protein
VNDEIDKPLLMAAIYDNLLLRGAKQSCPKGSGRIRDRMKLPLRFRRVEQLDFLRPADQKGMPFPRPRFFKSFIHKIKRSTQFQYRAA